MSHNQQTTPTKIEALFEHIATKLKSIHHNPSAEEKTFFGFRYLDVQAAMKTCGSSKVMALSNNAGYRPKAKLVTADYANFYKEFACCVSILVKPEDATAEARNAASNEAYRILGEVEKWLIKQSLETDTDICECENCWVCIVKHIDLNGLTWQMLDGKLDGTFEGWSFLFDVREDVDRTLDDNEWQESETE